MGLDVGEDGRLDEVSLGSVALSSDVGGGTLLLPALDVGHDALVLNLRGLGALEGLLVEGVSDLERVDLVTEEREELEKRECEPSNGYSDAGDANTLS